MDPLSLILVAIRGLSLVTNNPALGGGSSVRLQEASELLNILADLVQAGKAGHEELKAFTQVVQRMADEGRQPNTVEWAALRARSDAAHESLQAAKAELEEEEEPVVEEDLRTPEEIQADEEAEAARQAIAEEIAALEELDPEDRTEEEQARLDELTAPPEE